MIAGEADGGVLPGELDARVGFGAVADEVAQTPDVVAFGLTDCVEHGLEGMPVAVDVGDDRDAHGVQSRR